MTVRRIVPNFKSSCFDKCKDFYREIFGLSVDMDFDSIITLASPESPSARINLVRDLSPVPHPDVSIEVTDIESVYKCAIARGEKILYPLKNEPWGLRRFFVEDPNGKVINITQHL